MIKYSQNAFEKAFTFKKIGSFNKILEGVKFYNWEPWLLK